MKGQASGWLWGGILVFLLLLLPLGSADTLTFIWARRFFSMLYSTSGSFTSFLQHVKWWTVSDLEGSWCYWIILKWNVTLCPCCWASSLFPLEGKSQRINTASRRFEKNNPASSTHTYAWNALHRDLSHTLFEAGESWVNLPDLALFPLNQLLYNLIRHFKIQALSRKSSRMDICGSHWPPSVVWWCARARCRGSSGSAHTPSASPPRNLWCIPGSGFSALWCLWKNPERREKN